MLLHFFAWNYSIVLSGCFFVLILFWQSILGRTYHSLFIRIPWSRAPIFFFSLDHSPLIILLVFFRDRFVHKRFITPSAPLLAYFSNLPEIVFLLARDRLCRRLPFFPASFPLVAHSLFATSSFGMLVHFNFPEALSLSILTRFTRITSCPQVHSIFALTSLEIFILQFTFFRIVIFFSSPVTRPKTRFAHLFQSLQSWSIYLKYLSNFFFYQ